MEEFYIMLILLVLFTLYGVLSYQIGKEHDIFPAITEEEDIRCYHKGYKKKTVRVKTANGYYMSSECFIRIVINGDGLIHRGILDGEEWWVRPIKGNKPLDSQIRANDVVLIHNDESGKYVVRELSSINADGTLETSYKSDDDIIKEMTYTQFQIKGILQFCV